MVRLFEPIGGVTMKAFQLWHDGGEWWEVRDTDGTFLATVDNREEAAAHGATVFVETPEPRFLVRDESGRGWCAELNYTDIGEDEREYREEGHDTDYAGNEIEFQSFGDWLDNSDAGDEFNNGDQMFTVTRIN
jgi:hypothetical protein